MKFITVFFCLLILISSVNMAVSLSLPFPPFEVYTVEDLKAVDDLSPLSLISHIELMNDLEITDEVWKPIGQVNRPFKRIFNGNNHTITFKEDMEFIPSVDSENAGCGLFGYAHNGRIYDLNVIFQGNLTSRENNTGSLVGILDGNHSYSLLPAIVNCHISNDGYSISGKNNVGGLVGCVINSTIENSSAECSVVSSGNSAGGLVGFVFNGTIANSSASGSVQAVENAGGLIGYISNQTIVSNSSARTTISNSFADSSVKPAGKFGNFIGGWDENYKPEVVNCFYRETEVDLESVSPLLLAYYNGKPLLILAVGIGIIFLIAAGILYFKKRK